MGIRKPLLTVGQARRLAAYPGDAAQDQEQPGDAVEDAIAETSATPSPVVTVPVEAPPVPVPQILAPAAAPGASQAPAQATPPEDVPPPSRAPRREGSRMPAPIIQAAPETRVQVFVSAPLPARGVSAVYEQLCLQYAPAKALQMILRRALDEYDAMLQDGSFRKRPMTYAPLDSLEDDGLVQTSRMMKRPILAIARAHFDPLGLESARIFGRKLATAALANFFRSESQRYG